MSSSHESRSTILDKLRTKPAAIIITALGLTGLSACGSSAEAPKSNTTAEVAVPEADVVSETKPDVESPEATGFIEPTPLSAERLKTGEEVTNAFVEELNAWHMAGANSDLVERINGDMTIAAEDHVDEVVRPIDEAYTRSLFTDDFESTPSLAEYVNSVVESHTDVVYGHYLTSTPDNEEPYVTHKETTSIDVISESSDEVSVDWQYINVDNTDKNNLLEYGYKQTGGSGGGLLTFRAIEGEWKLVNVTPNS